MTTPPAARAVTVAATDLDVRVHAGDLEIGRYHVAPDAPADESPKPYWHPLRALDGGVVTGFRPWDHRWHKGLAMTWTQVSGQNFWGGPTFDRENGYVPRDNVGRIRHDRLTALHAEGSGAGFTEELTWITAAGEEWIAEERTHAFPLLDVERGFWVLDFSTRLRNIRGAELRLGSPTTAGRPAAGYTGLFLRMPRAWLEGRVLSDLDASADELMGAATEWIAYSGQHDDVDGGATVLVYSGTSSAPVPTRWFVRNGATPMLTASPSFDEEIVLAPGDELALTHRLVVIDRIPDEADLRALAAELTPGGSR